MTNLTYAVGSSATQAGYDEAPLPFTGMEVGIVGFVAFACIFTGIILRKLGKEKTYV